MIDYTHDIAWRADLDSCIETTANFLRTFGLGETKEIPTVLATELEDKNSLFSRLIDVFYDEVRLDAELAFAAETEGDKNYAYHDHARKKDIREGNMMRFNSVLGDAIIFCGMSKEYGPKFKDSIRSILNNSFPHQGFLFELYETVMFRTRWHLLEEKEKMK